MEPSDQNSNPSPGGIRALWRTEDWWSVWLALGIVLLALAIFTLGGTIKPFAVKPVKWATIAELTAHFDEHVGWYIVQFAAWAGLFAGTARVMGYEVAHFVRSFCFVYVCSILIFSIGAWRHAHEYNLEPPLVALLLGMLMANLGKLPDWMNEGFRVEYYIKIGIVLLGATLPFTLIVWAGPVAMLQATIVSVATFAVIYHVSKRIGLDRRLCAVLGAGGAVCGVSGAIAMAGVVRAKKEQLSIAISLVILWAAIMIFFLPFASRALGLSASVAGAWIGNSEFADAAGLAAAQAYGAMAEASPTIEGTENQAIVSFTLIKVIGRDMWIGLWAFAFALIATLRWEASEDGTGAKPKVGEIWARFPKFVLGFFVASLLMTAVTSGYSYEDYKSVVEPRLVGPIKDLRTWAFIFCFFSIGLTTRLKELVNIGRLPFLGFTAGVVINVILGFLLSTLVFASHWAQLPP